MNQNVVAVGDDRIRHTDFHESDGVVVGEIDNVSQIVECLGFVIAI